ncbi:MAG: M48 family metallopeptidase [Frankia sp.]|nr:M48 family metallopeptidase [Frankia sp.]
MTQVGRGGWDPPGAKGGAGAGSGRIRLVGLDADLFRHPLDRRATQNLRRVPGIDQAVAKFIEWGYERSAYVENAASGIRVGPSQLPRIHGLLREACAILDVPEPELYIRQGGLNAYTSGHNNPYIVLFTDLIDLLDEEELLAVIGHEVGHIKCGHVLYGSMARLFGGAAGVAASRLNPIVNLTIGLGVRAALSTWQRMAELSADRAAMLTVQDVQPCVRSMMKLAGGARSIVDELDPAAFLEQASHLDSLAQDSRLARLHRFRMRTSSDHPLLVERARLFDEWIRSDEPIAILRSHDRRAQSNGAGTDGFTSI